ncbi:MAG: cation transporter [Phycisphaerae bacterium]|nr:cation transporter [Phycisphaerae bacterium]
MDGQCSQGIRVSRLSVAFNGALALIKLAAGVLGHSAALVADSVESLADIFSSAIVWGGLVLAAKPADDDHPYGHGKAEPLAALAVAIMLLLAAVGIGLGAVREILLPGVVPAWYTLVVLIGVIALKEIFYRYQVGVGKRIGSVAVRADAWHHRSDALTSAAAAVGIAIALIGGPAYASADDWAALLACSIIVINGLNFARVAVAELMDTMPETAVVNGVHDVCHAVEGAELVEKVLVRKMGPRLYVDLHLEVDPEMSVRRAHVIAHEVKDAIMQRWPAVADVLVHVEPHLPPMAREAVNCREATVVNGKQVPAAELVPSQP